MVEKLDKKDLKLLYELEQDSRQSLSQIARKLKTSQQVISYRLQQFQKNKIITEFYTIINFAKLNYSSYRTMIRLGNATKEAYSELISFLKNHPNVLWFVECGGRWDLIVNILSRNPIQYNKFLLEIRNKFKNIIEDFDLLLTIEGIYFGRDYLIEKQREIKTKPYFGREIKIIKLDDLDLNILNIISQNARLNSVEIATKLKVSNNTIISRIKELKKKEIIQSFKPLIHLEKIGYQGYKALIKLNSISENKERELFTQLISNNNVVGILRMVGQWNLEVEFEVQTREEMLKISREIRTKFKEMIKEFEIIPLFHEYKYNFFPKDILSKK
ncbi:Lrp/AsnC family transcriptional regulator [archaeon]|nr:Lrp/AsnC family transcriptional regulator [archaeon]